MYPTYVVLIEIRLAVKNFCFVIPIQKKINIHQIKYLESFLMFRERKLWVKAGPNQMLNSQTNTSVYNRIDFKQKVVVSACEKYWRSQDLPFKVIYKAIIQAIFIDYVFWVFLVYKLIQFPSEYSVTAEVPKSGFSTNFVQ